MALLILKVYVGGDYMIPVLGVHVHLKVVIIANSFTDTVRLNTGRTPVVPWAKASGKTVAIKIFELFFVAVGFIKILLKSSPLRSSWLT